MATTIATKTASAHAPRGANGEVRLASGTRSAMRLWKDEQPGEPKPATTSPYETIGYVISGRAELHVDGNALTLEPGDSYVVPEGASHTYNILETFTAVESTTPAASSSP